MGLFKMPEKEYDLARDRIRLFKKCTVTGEIYEITVSYKKYVSWECGELIQNAFPNLSRYECEFIKTGSTPAEWDEMWKEEE